MRSPGKVSIELVQKGEPWPQAEPRISMSDTGTF